MIRTALFALLFVVTTAALPSVAHADPKVDLVDNAIANGNFKTLVKALTEAGLVDTLKGKGPFTVFAPNDEAFARLPKGELEALLKDKKKLTAVLTYHVVAGKYLDDAAIKLKSAKTVNGKSLKIKSKDGTVYVNDAKVTLANLDASNGVIHAIDTVLMPK
jgi:uncharacterized surface protein with fasciclin (FAS1) repeats